jgi:ankyrin repeat protein
MDVAKLLLAHGGEVNAFDNFGKTPLHNAVAQENIGMIQFLIENGADVNACKRGAGGTSPMAFALITRNGDIFKLLKEHGGKLVMCLF